MRFLNYLDEAKFNLSKLKDDLARVIGVTKKSMYFEDNELQIVEPFSGVNAGKESTNMVQQLRNIFKKHGFQKIKKSEVDSEYDIVTAYELPKLYGIITVETIGDNINIRCILRKK